MQPVTTAYPKRILYPADIETFWQKTFVAALEGFTGRPYERPLEALEAAASLADLATQEYRDRFDVGHKAGNASGR